jgi:hypothetical protein
MKVSVSNRVPVEIQGFSTDEQIATGELRIMFAKKCRLKDSNERNNNLFHKRL